MTFWTSLAGGIGLCLQAGISFRLQENFFSHRGNRYLAYTSGILLYLAVSLTASYTLNRQDWYFLYSVLRQSCLIVLLIWFFQGSPWNRAALAAISCVAFELAGNFWGELLSLFSMLFPASWQTFWDLFLYLAYPAAALTVWLAFRHLKLRPNIFSRQTCQLLFFVMCGLILLTNIVYHGITHGVIMISHIGYPEVFNISTSRLLTHLECIILSLLSLAMALCLPAALNRIMQQTVSEQIQRTQITHYQTLLEEHRRQVSLRHDLKNHLLVLNRLTEQGELHEIRKYLNSMCRETCQTAGNVYTGNPSADALLDIKEQAALAENIAFTCELYLPENLPLEDFDLCIVLGNLLDNAIHAAGRIPDTKERQIILQAKTVKRNLLLEIQNTTAGEISLRHFGSADYGTGLHNVKNMIEKYNGVMDISCEGSQFIVSILLPIT